MGRGFSKPNSTNEKMKKNMWGKTTWSSGPFEVNKIHRITQIQTLEALHFLQIAILTEAAFFLVEVITGHCCSVNFEIFEGICRGQNFSLGRRTVVQIGLLSNVNIGNSKF